VYLKRVVLDSIKAIEKSDLDFCPDSENFAGWCVITGDNGVGKTALLKAIGLALLGPDQARGLLPDLRGWITDGADRGTVSVEIKPDHDHDKTQRGGFPTQSTFWAEIEFTREGPAVDIGSADIFRNKKKSAVNGPWAQSTPGWLALGYGPFRRLYGSSPDAQRLMVIPGRIPRFATLYKEDATLGECEEWVRQLNYKQLEQRPDETLALRSLLTLLGADFLRQGLKIERVDSDGIWLRDDEDRIMPLSDMSEGYRAALAMLIDIFRHMVLTYGATDLVVETEDDCFVTKPAVVLIDEVDAHLHPAWQREIGFWLTRHFPRVQFIVTTHSPLVCQAADNGRIYHIPQPSDGAPFRLDEQSYESIIAGKPDQILLSPAFGLSHTRSPKAVRARERHARLTSKKRATGQLAFEEIQELSQLDLFARS
jgi:hypothetical protein